MAKRKKPKPPNGPLSPLQTRARTTAAQGNNIRNWRMFKGVATQEELSRMTARVDSAGRGINRATLLRLENGEVRYNEDHLNLISMALGVAPGDLIKTNPYNSGDIFAVFAGLSEADKRKALKLLAALKR